MRRGGDDEREHGVVADAPDKRAVPLLLVAIRHPMQLEGNDADVFVGELSSLFRCILLSVFYF